MKDFSVLSWERSDLAEIAELEKKCFDDPWNEEMLSASFSDENFFGFTAKTNGKVIGYIGVSSVFETADLLLIAVEENYRKEGVGRMLIERAIEAAKAKNAERMMLEVYENNTAAKSLYLSAGFRQIAVRKDYYGAGKNAFIMEKLLLNAL